MDIHQDQKMKHELHARSRKSTQFPFVYHRVMSGGKQTFATKRWAPTNYIYRIIYYPVEVKCVFSFRMKTIMFQYGKFIRCPGAYISIYNSPVAASLKRPRTHGFVQVGISGISMFSGQAPVMARAMASAKSMKKASWVVDMGRGIDPLYFTQVYIFQPSFSRAIFTKIWLMFMVKIGGLGKVTQFYDFYGSQDRPFTHSKLVLYRPPPKKTSSSHLLDVGVSENGFILAYCHIYSFFTRCIFFIRLPNICAIYIFTHHLHIVCDCIWKIGGVLISSSDIS